MKNKKIIKTIMCTGAMGTIGAAAAMSISSCGESSTTFQLQCNEKTFANYFTGTFPTISGLKKDNFNNSVIGQAFGGANSLVFQDGYKIGENAFREADFLNIINHKVSLIFNTSDMIIGKTAFLGCNSIE
jgi:hypothetical protein